MEEFECLIDLALFGNFRNRDLDAIEDKLLLSYRLFC